MNRDLTAWVFLLALPLAAAPTQQPIPVPAAGASASRGVASAAEQAFRDAWWADSGQGDLPVALRGYLAAAAADGPTAVRAKALLHAGAVQQRLGKTESAIATLRQVLKEHAGEADVVEQARVHLRELTAFDLRQGYDEWFDRWLFSEEVQLEILAKIRSLAATPSNTGDAQQQQQGREQYNQLRASILAYGKGAVPPLRKMVGTAAGEVRDEAAALLMELGEMPPAVVFATWEGWVDDLSMFERLLGSKLAGLPAPRPAESAALAMLRAAVQGPKALLEHVVTREQIPDDDGHFGQATAVLLRCGGEVRRATVAAMVATTTPARLRQLMERALFDGDPVPNLTAVEWLLVSADPQNSELATYAIERVLRRLTAADAAELDEVLVRVTAAVVPARGPCAAQLMAGLECNVGVELLPWSAVRLRTVLLAMRYSEGVTLASVLTALRRAAATRPLLAAAVFDEPSVLFDAFHGAAAEGLPGSLADNFEIQGDEAAVAITAQRWHRAVHEALVAHWEAYSPTEQAAAVALLGDVIRAGVGERQPLLEFLQRVRPAAPVAMQGAIDALLESWSGG